MKTKEDICAASWGRFLRIIYESFWKEHNMKKSEGIFWKQKIWPENREKFFCSYVVDRVEPWSITLLIWLHYLNNEQMAAIQFPNVSLSSGSKPFGHWEGEVNGWKRTLFDAQNHSRNYQFTSSDRIAGTTKILLRTFQYSLWGKGLFINVVMQYWRFSAPSAPWTFYDFRHRKSVWFWNVLISEGRLKIKLRQLNQPRLKFVLIW